MIFPVGSPEYNRAKTKRWRDTNPVGARRIHIKTNLRRHYGLSIEQYDAMFREQAGCCKLCGLKLISQTDETRPFKGHPPNEVGRVDHDHETGKVRGLLCFGCNVGLGKFRDDEKLLLKAVGYLRGSATQLEISRVPYDTVQGEIEPGNRDLDSSSSRGNRRKELSPFN